MIQEKLSGYEMITNKKKVSEKIKKLPNKYNINIAL